MCAGCGVTQLLIQQGKLFQCKKCGFVTNTPMYPRCRNCGAQMPDPNAFKEKSGDSCGCGGSCGCGPDCKCSK